MRRTVTISVALAVLVILAGCAGLGGSNAAPDTSSEGRKITVDAAGQVEAEPDQAVLRVAVEATADGASTARERLAKNVSRMKSALAEIGVTDEQITTVHYDLDKRHRRPTREGERSEPQYRAMHAFEITLSDINKTGEVIDTAISNGATSVDNVQFTLSRETRLELRQQALQDAMANARTEANVIASSANLSITGVGSVSTVQVRVSPHREVALASAGGDGGTSIESGPVTVTAQVIVSYNASAS